MDDEEFCGVLETLAPHVRNFFNPDFSFRFGKDRIEYNEFVTTVEKAMHAHNRYKVVENRFILDLQIILSPGTQSLNIVRMLAERTPRSIMQWYDKVIGTKSVDAVVFTCIEGLLPSITCQFENGVSIIPFEELPSSAEKKALLDKQFDLDFITLPIIGAVGKLDLGEINFSNRHERQHKLYNVSVSRISDVVTALSAFGKPLYELASWTHIFDQDIAEARLGATIKVNRSHPRGNYGYLDVGNSEIEFVNKFSNFPDEFRRKSLNALRRFHKALLQVDMGDRALDICIALEMMFGDDFPESQSFKIRMRSALLLSDDPAERRIIDAQIRDLYKIRSSVAHGGSSKVSHERFDVLV
jgi:hypothetical protein